MDKEAIDETSEKLNDMTLQQVVNNDADGEPDDDEEGDEMIDMPPVIAKRVIGLKKLQAKTESLADEYRIERLALEAKFMQLRKPLYEQRQQIIAGVIEPELTEEENVIDTTSQEDGAAELKGIPGFWSQCLTNSTLVSDFITDDDIPALNHLTDIECAYNEEMSSFTLSFHFSENEFFSNPILTKKYELDPDLLDEQSPSLSKIIGCEIVWKAGKNLCVGLIQKKQKGKSGKRKGQIRFVSREEPKPSFFHYFGEPADEDEDEEDEEDEEKEHIKFTVEEDYEIGHFLRTDVIPNAVLWFTGEAIDDDDEFGEDGEDDGDEDFDEDDDDDDDDGDDNKRLLANTQGQFTAAPSAETPECKQN